MCWFAATLYGLHDVKIGKVYLNRQAPGNNSTKYGIKNKVSPLMVALPVPIFTGTHVIQGAYAVTCIHI